MKPTFVLTLFFILSSTGYCTTAGPATPGMLNNLLEVLTIAKEKGHEIDLQQWRDIEQLPFELQVQALGSHTGSDPNISDYFVILPADERRKFPDYKIIVASAKPFNTTRWYREWHQSHDKYTKDQLAEYDRLNPVDEIVRWCLVEESGGRLRRKTISEEEFTRLLKENGIQVPQPTRYVFNKSQIDPATARPFNAPAHLSTSPTAVVQSTVPTATFATQPVARPLAESFNPLWWILGAIAAIGAVALIVRRKKPKA